MARSREAPGAESKSAPALRSAPTRRATSSSTGSTESERRVADQTCDKSLSRSSVRLAVHVKSSPAALEPVEVADCDVEPEPAGCEDFETGPMLIDLALDGTTTTSVSIAVPPGAYDEVEFDIHKVSGDDPEDAAFLEAYPEMDGKSIVVEGFYNLEPFVFETDLNEEQEYDLPPNLVIGEDAPATNITIRLDVSTWFVDANGNLFDPATALKGQPNENLAKDNIKNSIDAFEDEDEDGDDTDES